MHSKQSLILILGIFLIGLISVANAQCENKAVAPPCKLFADADVVFIGRVKEIVFSEPSEFYSNASSKINQRKKNISFEIKESFKGIGEKQTEITLSIHQIQQRSQSGALEFVKNTYTFFCVFDEFIKDDSYLVYAKKEPSEKDVLLFPYQAAPISEVDNSIQYLRDSKNSSQAFLFGSVVRKVSLAGGYGNIIERPLRNTRVEIRSKKETFTTTTDEKGNYYFSKIPPDEYVLHADLPEHLEDEIGNKKILVAASACTEHKVVGLTNGSIAGTLFNYEGQPISGLVSLLVASESGRPNQREFTVDVKWQTGEFEFKNIPPSQYYLVYGADRTCQGVLLLGTRRHTKQIPTHCQPRTYFPSVPEASQATLINLSEGEEIKDLELHLLPPIKARTISGVARMPDGKTLVNADIVLMLFQDERNESAGLIKTDEYGRFSIPAYEGLKYWINANVKIKNEFKHSEPRDLPLNGDVNSVELIVSSSGKYCSLCYNKYWKRKGSPQQ